MEFRSIPSCPGHSISVDGIVRSDGKTSVLRNGATRILPPREFRVQPSGRVMISGKGHIVARLVREAWGQDAPPLKVRAKPAAKPSARENMCQPSEKELADRRIIASREFRPIPRHPGYSISKCGLVWRHAKMTTHRPVPDLILAPRNEGERVAVDGRNRRIADLVAEAWIEEVRVTAWDRGSRPASSYRNGRVVTIEEYREWLREQRRELAGADSRQGAVGGWSTPRPIGAISR